MLLLNLNEIRTPHERFEQVYQPDALAGDRETFSVAAPLDLAFDIYKDKDQFRVVGGVQTTLELLCGRCLQRFMWPLGATFDLRYQPYAHNAGEGEREIEDGDLSTAFYENDAIDLGQLMREQLYLSLPMKPLCREDCRGLCPQCGTNWNLGKCDCRPEWVDPRFAALKALKKES